MAGNPIDWSAIIAQVWPQLVAPLVCVVIALARMGRNRATATKVVVAMTLFVAATLLPMVAFQYLIGLARGVGFSSPLYSIATISGLVLRSAAIGLLVWAAFAGRSSETKGAGFSVLPSHAASVSPPMRQA